jgi:predicted DNA-binding WGR domain protein
VLEGDWVNEPPLSDGRRRRRGGVGSGQYYLFRSWGRVGTDIGDMRLELCPDRDSAIEYFKEKFLSKTGNEFTSDQEFVKVTNACACVCVCIVKNNVKPKHF